MTRKQFTVRVVVSAGLTLAVLAGVIWLVIAMFSWYSPPDEGNTHWVSARVTEIYSSRNRWIVLVLDDGDELSLVYPNTSQGFYDAIGCDFDGLTQMLEGQAVICRRMDDLPWAVEVRTDDAVIDNTALTAKQMTYSRIGIVVVGTIAVGLVLVLEGWYLEGPYRRYEKYRKKAKREREKADRKPPVY